MKYILLSFLLILLSGCSQDTHDIDQTTQSSSSITGTSTSGGTDIVSSTASGTMNTIENTVINSGSQETILLPVKTLIEAMENEDAETIRAQFAQTATQAYGSDGTMKSAEETAKWLESDIISRQGKVKDPQFTVLSANEVVVQGQYTSRGYSNKADFLFVVENGLITSWRMRY